MCCVCTSDNCNDDFFCGNTDPTTGIYGASWTTDVIAQSKSSWTAPAPSPCPSPQDALTAISGGSCSCGTATPTPAVCTSGEYCDGDGGPPPSLGVCQSLPACDYSQTVIAPGTGCQCGPNQCTANTQYCFVDQSTQECRSEPADCDTTGTSKVAGTCKCGSTTCTNEYCATNACQVAAVTNPAFKCNAPSNVGYFILTDAGVQMGGGGQAFGLTTLQDFDAAEAIECATSYVCATVQWTGSNAWSWAGGAYDVKAASGCFSNGMFDASSPTTQCGDPGSAAEGSGATAKDITKWGGGATTAKCCLCITDNCNDDYACGSDTVPSGWAAAVVAASGATLPTRAPTTVAPTAAPGDDEEEGGGSDIGMIIGIVVGAVVIIGGGAFFMMKKKNGGDSSSEMHGVSVAKVIM